MTDEKPAFSISVRPWASNPAETPDQAWIAFSDAAGPSHLKGTGRTSLDAVRDWLRRNEKPASLEGSRQAVKAADLPAAVLLDAVGRINATGRPALLSELQDELSGFPPKVVLAKLAKLVKQQGLTGCICGCRGDFEVSRP